MKGKGHELSSMYKYLCCFSLSLILLVSAPAFTPAAELINATVSSISDGDTLTVQNANSKIKVRLACIDAPESNQEFGSRSTLRLQQLLPVGSEIKIYKVDTDRYGRTVGVIFANRTGRDFNVNTQMVREGYAVVYEEYLYNCPSSREQLFQVEQEAKANQRVIWSQANACMPWDYRQGQCQTQLSLRPTNRVTNNTNNNCDPNYSGACIPPYPPDLNCGDITARGFQSTGTDPHRLDRDKDGIACE